MTPITTPERTYCERRTASTARRSALRGHPVAGLELRRIDDLHVVEGHLGLRVLGHQHGRRPLLPVRALAPRERDGPVPALELVVEQGLDDVLALVALRRVDGVG